MRRKSSDYKREVKDEPFELELDATKGKGAKAEPVVVQFIRGGKSMSMEVIDMMGDYAAMQEKKTTPREIQLRFQLGSDNPLEPSGASEVAYQAFWAEWKKKSREELDDLVADIDAHFADGVPEGKALSSIG